MNTSFDCSRTCPLFERVDQCRFNPLLRSLGASHTTNSTTTKVRLEVLDADLLWDTAVELGARMFPEGTGLNFSFLLTGMKFTYDANTKALQGKGGLGVKAVADKLQATYTLALAEKVSAELNWASERIPTGVRTHHPRGGYLDTKYSEDGTVEVEAIGFRGNDCHTPVQKMTRAFAQAKNVYAARSTADQQARGSWATL